VPEAPVTKKTRPATLAAETAAAAAAMMTAVARAQSQPCASCLRALHLGSLSRQRCEAIRSDALKLTDSATSLHYRATQSAGRSPAREAAL
jgi:hypothetical protein